MPDTDEDGKLTGLIFMTLWIMQVNFLLPSEYHS